MITLKNMSKAELIEWYKDGKLKDVAYCVTEYYYRVIIIDADDENVFGYIQAPEGEKKFFKVQSYIGDKDITFRVNKQTYYFNDFMRF